MCTRLGIRTLYLCLLVGLWSIGGAWAQAQSPRLVNPYELLTRRSLPSRPPLDAAALTLDAGAAKAVRERSESLLARTRARLAPFGPKAQQDPSFKELLAIPQQNIDSARAKLLADQPAGAHWKAMESTVLTEMLDGAMLAAGYLLIQGVSEGTQAASLVPDIDAELARFQQRLALVPPTSVPTVLALTLAYSDWVDAQIYRDMARDPGGPLARLMRQGLASLKHPGEGESALDKLPLGVAQGLERGFVQLAGEVLAVPVIRLGVEASETRLYASLGAGPPLRLSLPELRRVADAYLDAAQANAERYEALRPVVRAAVTRFFHQDEHWLSDLGEEVTRRRFLYLRAHREAQDLPQALALLGCALSTYSEVLARVSLAQALSPRTAEEALPIGPLLDSVDESARQAAAQTHAATGGVPPAVRYDYDLGRSLRGGDAFDQVAAYESLWQAVALAHLSLVLSGTDGAPAVVPPVAGEESILAECAEDLLSFNEQRRQELVEHARGYLAKRSSAIPPDEWLGLIHETVLKICDKAKDRESDMRPLFWEELKHQASNWSRREGSLTRRHRALGERCPESPPETIEEERVRRETEEQREQRGRAAQALCLKLPEADRVAIQRKLHDGKTYEEIGRELGSTPEATRKRVHRALERLKKQLPPEVSTLWLLRGATAQSLSAS